MKEKENPNTVCEHCGFSMQKYKAPGYVLPPFTALNGRYLVGRVTGESSFEITYIAKDLIKDQVCTIKEFYIYKSFKRGLKNTIDVSIKDESDAIQYNRALKIFRDEARILTQLGELPGIVKVKDYFEQNNTSYIVMDYLPGPTLRQYIKDAGGISFENVVSLLNPVMRSLQALHDHHVIHGDINPEKLIFSGNNELTLIDINGGQSYLEFGLFHIRDYLPVESFSEGAIGPWTDVYSMASTLYYCITNENPPSIIDRVSNNQKLLLKPGQSGQSGVKISRYQENVLRKGMEIKHEDRYQTMDSFIEALSGSQKTGLLEKIFR